MIKVRRRQRQRQCCALLHFVIELSMSYKVLVVHYSCTHALTSIKRICRTFYRTHHSPCVVQSHFSPIRIECINMSFPFMRLNWNVKQLDSWFITWHGNPLDILILRCQQSALHLSGNKEMGSPVASVTKCKWKWCNRACDTALSSSPRLVSFQYIEHNVETAIFYAWIVEWAGRTESSESSDDAFIFYYTLLLPDACVCVRCSVCLSHHINVFVRI